jgi:hypothetical protein
MGLNNPLGLAVGETPQITFRFCAHCQATADSLEDLKPDYCRRRDQPELAEGRHAIVKPDFLCDLAVIDPKYRHSGEMHPSTCRRRQGAHEEVTEDGAGVRAAAFPAANYIVALCDEIGSSEKSKIRKCFTKSGHESFDFLPAAARRMKRVPQEHVGSGEFVDHTEIAGLAPELGEPTAYNRLVVLYLGHDGTFAVIAC